MGVPRTYATKRSITSAMATIKQPSFVHEIERQGEDTLIFWVYESNLDKLERWFQFLDKSAAAARKYRSNLRR